MDRQELERLIQNPRESLSTELKQWIDPSTPEGICKIAKACIALRNNNGGCLVIGFDDNGQPDPAVPANIRAAFHSDVIQGIATRFASQPFEVTVEFVERGGVEYPVICVPSGVETPVAAKSDLLNPDNTQPPLVRVNTVYVRSLNSNNTVSSSPARWNDWPQVARSCFDNREADIGSFLRRHLSSVDPRQLRLAMRSLRPARTAGEEAMRLLDYGKGRFEAGIARRQIVLPNFGYRETGVVVDGTVPPQRATEEWRFRMRASAPDHSGWPAWVDLHGAQDEHLRPYVAADGFEALVVELGPGAIFETHVDFWRMDPSGKFYVARAFRDDMARPQGQQQPGTVLDPMLQIGEITEIMAIAQSFARTLGCNEQTTALEFAFRWTGLENRLLAIWSTPGAFIRATGRAAENTKVVQVRLPLETAPASLASYVAAATQPLFNMFGGYEYSAASLAQIVERVLSRRF
jgi:Schlafen, AlbA_2